MPKYICKCANTIDLSPIPNSNELLMIEDVNFEMHFENYNPISLHQDMILTIRCDKCKRLFIFEKGYENNPIVYQKEEGDWS